MIDLTDRVKRALHQQFKKFDEMSSSANIFSNNLKYQRLNEYKEQIPLIDFDVVYSGIASLSVLDFSFTIESLHSENPKNLIVGSNSIKYLFSKPKRYCLPFGTKNELLDKKFSLANKIGSKARVFQERLKQSKDKDDPIRYILEKYSSKDLNEIIINEFNDINLKLDDFLYLDNVLNNSLDVEDIITKEIDFDNSKTFKKALDYLKNERPDRPSNNLNDALNISTIPLILGNKLNKSRNLPVFITRTEQIYKAGSMFNETDKFEIFNKYYYLFFSQLISEYNEGDIDSSIRYSTALSQDLNILKNEYFHLIVAINNREVDPLDFNSKYYRRIEMQHNRFLDTWNWMYEPFLLNSLLDTIGYQNALKSNNFKELLYNSTDTDSSKKNLIEKVLIKLEEDIINNTVFNRILLMSNPEVNKYIHQNDKLPNFLHFSFIKPSEDSGLPFAEFLPLKSTYEGPIKDRKKDGVRVFVNLKLSIVKGSLFSFDSYPDNSFYKESYGISWPHYCDKELILIELFNLLRDLFHEAYSEFKGVLTNDKGDLITISIKDINNEQIIRSLNEKNFFIFFSSSFNEFRVFADLEANIDEKEMQVGLILNKELIKTHISRIVDMIINTSIFRSERNTDLTEFKELYNNTLYYLTNLL